MNKRRRFKAKRRRTAARLFPRASFPYWFGEREIHTAVELMYAFDELEAALRRLKPEDVPW